MEEILTQTIEKTSLDDVMEGGNELLVFNDDVHTFDYVIDCLQKICTPTITNWFDCD